MSRAADRQGFRGVPRDRSRSSDGRHDGRDPGTLRQRTGKPIRCCCVEEQAVREAATICPRPCKLTFDLLTLKVVSESRVTWATSVPILVLLGLSVLDLGPIYATDVRRASSRDARATGGGA